MHGIQTWFLCCCIQSFNIKDMYDLGSIHHLIVKGVTNNLQNAVVDFFPENMKIPPIISYFHGQYIFFGIKCLAIEQIKIYLFIYIK
jgi:hypothetical protein